MLTERRARILQSLIQEYISTAMPVSSEAVLKSSGLKVSSATVRNEMAQLEEEGYIVQPHTSAGRVPSTKGYRYYVEILLRERQLSLEEQRLILHQFYQTGREIEEWTHLAAAILSRMLQNVAVVTLPQMVEPKLRQLKLISLNESMALLVLVFDDARFRQRTVVFETPILQEQLNSISQRLSDVFEGLTSSEIGDTEEPLSPIEQRVIELVMELMGEGEVGEPYFDGVSHVLSQPEFSKSDRASLLMELLEKRTLLSDILAQAPGDEKLRVIIGEEASESALQGLSVVLSRYGNPQQASGVIGVLGPIRMPYERVFPAIRFLSGTMSERLDDSYR